MIHAAIVRPVYARAILSGEKQIEARLTVRKKDPWGRIAPGEWVYFKSTGGTFVARARVLRVALFKDLTPDGVGDLRREYNDQIGAPESFWSHKRSARFACLVWLEGAEPVSAGPDYRAHESFHPREAWFVLPESFAPEATTAARPAASAA